MAADEDHAEWEYRVVQVDSGRGDGISFTIICNGKRIIVNFLPIDSLEGTIEGPLIERYEAACFDEDEEEEEAVQQEIEDIIYDVGRPIFARLAPPVARGSRLENLHSLLYPETLSFRFATINGKAEILEQDFDAEQYYPPPPIKINDDLGLPRYCSKDVQVLEKIQGQGEITRVLVDGQERCCKSGEPFNWEAVEREFDCLCKIARSQHASSIRTPKLTGLVTSADNGQIVGILEEIIPTDLKDLPTLREVDASIVAESRRRKWASQIREMVDLLHEIRVVWGDGKPHNVLIHRDTDDAWLIDFGGSWTDGWVDAELMETVEGDEQAVRRILHFLAV